MPVTRPPRESQADRLRRALGQLRETLGGELGLRPLSAAERSRFASRLLAEQWTRKNFSVIGARASWRGDALKTLEELSYYMVPRTAWAVRRYKRESWVRREQTWTLLLLVQHKLGAKAAKWLRAAYVANGVKYRPRRVLSASQREKLSTRFTKPKLVTTAFPRVAGRRRITFEDE